MLQKNALLFLLEASAHHSFTSNSQFLHEQKHKVSLQRHVQDLPFLIPFHFLLKSSFLFDKKHGLFDL